MVLVDNDRTHALGKVGKHQNPCAHAIFHRHVRSEVRQGEAGLKLAQGDLAGLRALGVQGLERFGREVRAIGLECRQNVFVAVGSKQALDCLGMGGNLRLGRDRRNFAQDRRDVLRIGCDARLGLDRKSTRLNSSHIQKSRMPSSA